MYDMSVTFAVLKLEISKLVRLVQPPNMLDIVVTFAVLKPVPKSICSTLPPKVSKNIKAQSGLAYIWAAGV